MTAYAAPQENRNVRLLVVCQALYVCASAIGLTLTGLVGAMLAPARSLATLPFALVIVATAVGTIPVSLAMANRGRRPLFMLGAGAGVLGGALAAWAIADRSFAGFCLANMLLGLFQACAQYYRFAATEAASAALKPRAIGLVIGGGVVAAIVGPTLAAWARDIWAPHTFAGSYLAVMALAGASTLVLSQLNLAPDAAPRAGEASMPLRTLARNPCFIAAVSNSALGYAIMIFVMTATPLAVVACGLSVGEAASVIQWHLLSMFAPGFFTGRLIARWGVTCVLLSGAALFVAGVMLALSGTSLAHFGGALALNGLAWNFMFVGGSTLLTQGLANAGAADRARAQAANEFITFAVVATGSLLAGATFNSQGWNTVNGLVLPFVALAALSTLWLWRTSKPRATATG
ncbi:MFS transporter [Verminephrobacter aporrectodeae subsp. tuberculatae]|uniref:MFS transporter n=1 Tax=Verminephrobacter aporrectodeae TaxID=1110389 RepID=UPI00224495CE|nr:MFS transporter [Verminephrobacter aporrectodeae]MCW8196937.1 MFS transporter [Verminephrobacter aporrectodeae subsp. tuberculatae]